MLMWDYLDNGITIQLAILQTHFQLFWKQHLKDTQITILLQLNSERDDFEHLIFI